MIQALAIQAAINVDQDKGWAGGFIRGTPASTHTLDQGGFSRAQVPRQTDDISWLYQAAEAHSQAACLFRAAADDIQGVGSQDGHRLIIASSSGCGIRFQGWCGAKRHTNPGIQSFKSCAARLRPIPLLKRGQDHSLISSFASEAATRFRPMVSKKTSTISSSSWMRLFSTIPSPQTGWTTFAPGE